MGLSIYKNKEFVYQFSESATDELELLASDLNDKGVYIPLDVYGSGCLYKSHLSALIKLGAERKLNVQIINKLKAFLDMSPVLFEGD